MLWIHESNVYLRCLTRFSVTVNYLILLSPSTAQSFVVFWFICCCFVVIEVVGDAEAGTQGLVHARQASALPLSPQAFAGGFVAVDCPEKVFQLLDWRKMPLHYTQPQPKQNEKQPHPADRHHDGVVVRINSKDLSLGSLGLPMFSSVALKPFSSLKL